MIAKPFGSLQAFAPAECGERRQSIRSESARIRARAAERSLRGWFAAVKEDAVQPRLTDRQLEILSSITRGLTNQDIANQFGITEIGVKKHLSAIFDKLGAANRSEAVAIALKKQLLKL